MHIPICTPVTMSQIRDLPSELLLEIAESIDPKDLRAARLVCKDFCTAVVKPFAQTSLNKRAYSICPQGLEVLADITAHELFGRYIDTVIIQAEIVGDRKQMVRHNRSGPQFFVKRALDEQLPLLEQAFRSLQKHRNHLTIGVRTVSSDTLIDFNHLFLQDDAGDVESQAMHGFGWKKDQHCRRIDADRAFEFVYGASQANGLKIDCIDIGCVNHSRSHSMSMEIDRKWLTPRAVMGELAEKVDGLKDAALKFHLQRLGESTTDSSELPHVTKNDSQHFSYDSTTRTLEISGLECCYQLRGYYHGISCWQPEAPFKKLRMSRCEMLETPWFNKTFMEPFKDGVEMVEFKDMKFCFEWNWTELMKQLATFPNLEHCSFKGLGPLKSFGEDQHLMICVLANHGHGDELSFCGHDAAQQIGTAIHEAEAMDREAMESLGMDYEDTMSK